MRGTAIAAMSIEGGNSGGGGTRAMRVHPGLTAFIQDRRVRFTVASEQVIGPQGPIAVGFDVRLFAWHGHQAHAPDGCRVCALLESSLLRIADLLVGGGDRRAEIEIDPEYSVLYESREAPGTDEVVLDLRVLRRGHDDRPVGPEEERYARDLIGRVKALGIVER